MSHTVYDEIPNLSIREMLILKLLSESGETYGLDMVKQSGGRLKRGTIYVTLDRMEDKGLIESKLEQLKSDKGGPTRRLYSITGHGARILAVWERPLVIGNAMGETTA